MRIWSLLFGAMAVLCVAAFAYAPFDPSWWLPQNVSTTSPLHLGAEIDHLFLLILWITGVVFIGTHIALVYTMYRYGQQPGRQAHYFHGSQRLEVIWTIIPAAILVFISLYQMGTWADIKFRSAQPKVKPHAEVIARQFQWKIRYPGPDGLIGTRDDLHTINDFRFVKGEPIVINLKTEDVLHSFNLPNLRIKQDAVPGLTIPVWFDADQATTAGRPLDLVCTELCGWGHTKMKGRVTIYDTPEQFREWVQSALDEQNRSQLSPSVATAAATAPSAGEN